jgi:hypothetical protein
LIFDTAGFATVEIEPNRTDARIAEAYPIVLVDL